MCVGTVQAGAPTDEGGLDVSPRGDPPGFVRVLVERTLFMPERPGNHPARGPGEAAAGRDARGEGLH